MSNKRSDTERGSGPDAAPADDTPVYLEIWGDTVVGRDLGISVLIGSVVGASTLLLSGWYFSGVVENESLADAYALLVGIAFCVVAGVISGKLFSPKRTFAEDASEGDGIDDAIRELQAEPKGLGHIADLPEVTIRELKELDLYDRFLAAEQQSIRRPKGDMQ